MIKTKHTIVAISLMALASNLIVNRPAYSQTNSVCERNLLESVQAFRKALVEKFGEDGAGVEEIEETIKALTDPKSKVSPITALGNSISLLRGNALQIMGIIPTCLNYARERLNKLPVDVQRRPSIKSFLNRPSAFTQS